MSHLIAVGERINSYTFPRIFVHKGMLRTRQDMDGKYPGKIKLVIINLSPNRPECEKGDVAYLVGLERYCNLQAPSARSDCEFRAVLFPV